MIRILKIKEIKSPYACRLHHGWIIIRSARSNHPLLLSVTQNIFEGLVKDQVEGILRSKSKREKIFKAIFNKSDWFKGNREVQPKKEESHRRCGGHDGCH